MKILADSTLPNLTTLFPPPFSISRYSTKQELQKLLPMHNILLCRANLPINAELLQNQKLQYIATASSGTDHIDTDYVASQGITILDAKGCNSQAVTDYVVSVLATLHQQNYAIGKRAGVIGIGTIGTKIFTRLRTLGFDVIGYDPLQANNKYANGNICELLTCDLICIHAAYHQTEPYPSANLINIEFLNQLQANTIIINAARGGIVVEQDLLATKVPLIYCTDVYHNEPNINADIVQFATICTPHIAGHSLEAKAAILISLSTKLHNLCNLPIPTLAKPRTQPLLALQTKATATWQDVVLSLYNPLIETMQLKQAIDKQRAFLMLRQAHKQRHDFNCYESYNKSS